MHYKCNKINLNWGGLHIDSPGWVKKKLKEAINHVDDKSFQYGAKVLSNHEEIRKNS